MTTITKEICNEWAVNRVSPRTDGRVVHPISKKPIAVGKRAYKELDRDCKKYLPNAPIVGPNRVVPTTEIIIPQADTDSRRKCELWLKYRNEPDMDDKVINPFTKKKIAIGKRAFNELDRDCKSILNPVILVQTNPVPVVPQRQRSPSPTLRKSSSSIRSSSSPNMRRGKAESLYQKRKEEQNTGVTGPSRARSSSPERLPDRDLLCRLWKVSRGFVKDGRVINPKTGKLIRVDSDMYRQLDRECQIEIPQSRKSVSRIVKREFESSSSNNSK